MYVFRIGVAIKFTLNTTALESGKAAAFIEFGVSSRGFRVGGSVSIVVKLGGEPSNYPTLTMELAYGVSVRLVCHAPHVSVSHASVQTSQCSGLTLMVSTSAHKRKHMRRAHTKSHTSVRVHAHAEPHSFCEHRGELGCNLVLCPRGHCQTRLCANITRLYCQVN